MEITLGAGYQDSVTGFVGVATARCEHLHGTPIVQLTSVAPDGSPLRCWFDENRLKLILDIEAPETSVSFHDVQKQLLRD